MSRINECRSCKKPFYVTEVGGGMPGTKEREDITCPYCGDTVTEISNGTFLTSKLSPEAERIWRRNH